MTLVDINRGGENSSSPDLIQTLRNISLKACAIAAVIGCVVILGWIFNLTPLKSVVPIWVTMKANTAFGFIFGGGALWLWHRYPEDPPKRQWAQWLSMIVVLIGLLTLLEYSQGWNLGIDQLIFKEGAVGTSNPGRMAPNSALNFLFVGAALLFFIGPYVNYQAAQILAIASFLAAWLGILGYLYGAQSLYGIGSYTQMPLDTAITFIFISMSILFANPAKGYLSVITSQNAGGIISRRLAPLAIGVPPLLGWLIVQGYRAKAYDAEVQTLLLVVLHMIVFGWLIWWNARSLSHMDLQRLRAEDELRELNAELEARVIQRTAELEEKSAQLVHSELVCYQKSSILQLVLSRMGDGVVVLDQHGEYLLCNQAAKDIMGMDLTETPVNQWAEKYNLFLPDTVTPFPREDLPLVRSLQGQIVNHVEIFIRHPQKPEGGWIKANARPLKDENETLQGAVVLFYDITAAKQAEAKRQQLTQEQKQLLFALENRNKVLDDAAIVSETDRKGQITFTNDKFCQISGYTREELMGKDHRIVNSGHHPKSFFLEMWKTISSGQIWKGEIKNKAKNGSYYWVETNISPIFDSQGNLVKYIAIRIDITERKNAEARLEQLAAERKAETDKLTKQVLTMLNEIKGAARGDLTVKAKVTNDSLGTIADSFNFLISSLRQVVNSIQEVAGQVKNASGESIAKTNELAAQARNQSQQIEMTLQQIKRMVDSIKDVSNVAGRAEKVAEQSAKTAEFGGVAVDKTVQGINELRHTIADTAKMIKRLGESSQQIGKIVTSISQIASQTNLLALNATIEAARAGEQGQGFAVVAEEVRKLAERSASATEEIAEIVSTIQEEISRVMSAMESGTQEVVEGTNLAAEAKNNLVAIIEVSREMNSLVQNITSAAKKQAGSVEEIANNVKQVSEISITTAKNAEDVTASLDGLAVAVSKLQNSVSNFRS